MRTCLQAASTATRQGCPSRPARVPPATTAPPPPSPRRPPSPTATAATASPASSARPALIGRPSVPRATSVPPTGWMRRPASVRRGITAPRGRAFLTPPTATSLVKKCFLYNYMHSLETSFCWCMRVVIMSIFINFYLWGHSCLINQSRQRCKLAISLELMWKF